MRKEEMEALIRITESIEETYSKMIELEKENKTESEEYQRLVTCLKTTVNVERNIISNADLDNNTLKELEEKLTSLGYKETENLTDTIINNVEHNTNDLIYQRIIVRLKAKSFRNAELTLTEGYKQLLPKEIIESQDFTIDENSKEIYNQIIEINFSLRRDMSLFLYKILNDKIKEEQNVETRNYLIDYKYSLIKLDSNLETMLLESSFKPLENICMVSPLIARILNAPTDLLEVQKRILANLTSQYEIISITKSFDYHYDTPVLKTAIIFRSLVLKSSIEFLNQEDFKELYNSIVSLLESEYYKSTSFSQKNLATIKECFNSSTDGINRLTLKG